MLEHTKKVMTLILTIENVHWAHEKSNVLQTWKLLAFAHQGHPHRWHGTKLDIHLYVHVKLYNNLKEKNIKNLEKTNLLHSFIFFFQLCWDFNAYLSL